MKKSRLLEIIREEISSVLNEVDIDKTAGAVIMKKTTQPADIKRVTSQGIDVELKEDQLDEMAKITEPIRKGIEVAVGRLTKQKSDITPEEITKLIRNKKSQEKVAPELKSALDADEAEKGDDPKYTYGLGYPQTLGAVQIAMGLKKAKGSEPKAATPAKEKAPKTTAEKAPKANPMDDEDAAASKAADSDSTAKELASTPEEKKVKFNQFLSSVKKNKDDKAKIDGILKLAKDKFKFAKSMMDDLKRAAGREVEA
jgi:hypothetical protein